MYHLEGLLHTFITVIVRYHNRKRSLPVDKESEEVQALLKKPRLELCRELEALVKASTETDKSRLTLLMYTLHNTELLKSFCDSKIPIPHEALDLIKKQLLQFTIDIQSLLTTSQSIELTIKYNQLDVKMYGLKRSALMGYSLCDSGDILSNTLFPALRLAPDAPIEKIDQTITGIFKEHNNSLLIKALTQENSLLSARVSFLEAELKAQKSSLQRSSNPKSSTDKQPQVQKGTEPTAAKRSNKRNSPQFSLFNLFTESLGLSSKPLRGDEDEDDSSKPTDNSHNSW